MYAYYLFLPAISEYLARRCSNKAVVFTQLITLSVLIRSIHGPLSLFYMGVGKIKRMVFIESFIFAFMLPVCYLILKCGFREWSVYAILVIVEALIVLSLTFNMNLRLALRISLLIVFCHVLFCLSFLALWLLQYRWGL